MSELDEMKGELRKVVARVLLKRSLERYSSYSPETLNEVINAMLEAETDTCRIAVVRKEGEIPDPDPHGYEGEFEAICSTKEAAYKAGWVKEVKDEPTG